VAIIVQVSNGCHGDGVSEEASPTMGRISFTTDSGVHSKEPTSVT